MEEGSVRPYIYYFLFFILQKKCHVLKIGDNISDSVQIVVTACYRDTAITSY